MGHSYGAYVYLLRAATEPSLVRTMVPAEPPVLPLVASVPPTPPDILRLLVHLMMWGAIAVPDGCGFERTPRRSAVAGGLVFSLIHITIAGFAAAALPSVHLQTSEDRLTDSAQRIAVGCTVKRCPDLWRVHGQFTNGACLRAGILSRAVTGAVPLARRERREWEAAQP